MFFQTAEKPPQERKEADGSAKRQKSVVIMTDNPSDDRKGGTDRKSPTDLSGQNEPREVLGNVVVKDTEETGSRNSAPGLARVTPKQDMPRVVTLPEIHADRLTNTLRIEGRWFTCPQLALTSVGLGGADVALGYYVLQSTRKQFTKAAFAAADKAIRTPGSLGKKILAASTLAATAGATTLYTGVCYRDEINEKKLIEERGYFKGFIGGTTPAREPVVDLDPKDMMANKFEICRPVSMSIGTFTRKAAKVDYCWPATQTNHSALLIPMGTEVYIPFSKPRR